MISRGKEVKILEKQKLFVEEYIRTGELAKSARKAGYRGRVDVTANTLMKKPHVQEYYKQQLELYQERMMQSKIASIDSVLEFLTNTMTDEETSKGHKLKAAEMLLKFHSGADITNVNNVVEIDIDIIDTGSEDDDKH